MKIEAEAPFPQGILRRRRVLLHENKAVFQVPINVGNVVCKASMDRVGVSRGVKRHQVRICVTQLLLKRSIAFVLYVGVDGECSMRIRTVFVQFIFRDIHQCTSVRQVVLTSAST